MNFPSDHLLTSKSKWRINEKIQTAADRKWGMGQSKKQGGNRSRNVGRNII